jgi:hypothetical protein
MTACLQHVVSPACPCLYLNVAFSQSNCPGNTWGTGNTLVMLDKSTGAACRPVTSRPSGTELYLKVL